MQVVSAAMIMTNTGRRTASVTAPRISATAAFEQASTRAVARPMPRALTTELLTPSSGQRPSNCTSPGLFFHRPLTAISR
ncbi:hypothetical protein D3C71_1910840 [compost metagenome]